MAQAKVQPYILRNLKGRNGSAPENIEDSQFQTLENWYPRDKILKRRKGTTAVSALPYSAKITGAAVYLPSGRNYEVLLGAADAICKLDGQEIVALATTTSAITTDTLELWQMQQYKNSMYCLRADIGALYRSDGDQVNDTGIAAPTVALTAADGAAPGVLDAGDYEVVYTYYNSATGAESNPSPVATVTVSASGTVDYTDLGVSTNPQVDSRKIYRSLVDSEGEWFHVLTILDNQTTAYAGEDAALADMGLPAEQTNGVPPTNIDAMEVHQERMWLTDGLLVYFSELGLPESFAGASSLNVKSDDGYLIRSIKSFGEVLLILKQNGIYYLAGSDEQSFQIRTLHDRHGCVARDTVAVAEGYAIWFGGDNFYLTDGNRVSAIGDLEVQDIIADIDSDDYSLMTADIYPDEGWYMCAIPENGAITKWLAYNYRSGNWHVMTWSGLIGQPTFMKLLPDDNGKPVVYAALSGQVGHINELFRGDDDLGREIACTLRTKNFGLEKEDNMKIIRDVQMLISTTGVAEDVTVAVIRDDDVLALTQVSWNTFDGKQWQRIGISSNGYPGNFLSLRVQYSGDADFDIEGFAFKIVDLGRQAPLRGVNTILTPIVN